MQQTSALWQSLWAGGGARLETVAAIGGREYAAISAPVICRALTQAGLSVGNAVSATCQLSVLTEDAIERASEVVVRMRLSDGVSTSEWRPAGTFYVSHRDRDAVTGLTTLQCYDGMLKANAEYPRSGSWPRAMAQVVDEIAQLLGVTLDARTQIQSGDGFRVTLPEAGATIREVLCGIGAAHGGNWVLTPENKLRLVPLAADAAGTADVAGVLGGVSAGSAQTITALVATVGGQETARGSDGGLTLRIESPYMTEAALDWLENRLIGARYQPFTLRAAIYDPAVELGDTVRSRSDVASTLYCENATLGLAFRGDISAPEPEELADEYPYIGNADRLKRLREQVRTLEATKADGAELAAAEARADSAARGYASAAQSNAEAVARALDQALGQTEIFNRLTDNGAVQGLYLKNGRLYINGSYIDTGTLDADLIRAGTITDGSGENYWVLAGNDSEFVTRKGVIGDFTLEDGGLQYGSLTAGGRGAYIGSEGVTYNVTLNSGNAAKTQIFAQGLKLYWNDVLKTMLYLNRSGIILRCYDENGNATYPLQIYDDNSFTGIYLRYNTYATQHLYVDEDSIFYKDLEIHGDMSVSGAKNRRVRTEDYADRLLYCYEMPTPMFGDAGEGVIAEDGRCHVWLDPVFAETIEGGQYQVFLQGYGAGECHVARRDAGCFVVEGKPGLAFGWELKGRQRDFSQRRLDRTGIPAARRATDFGALALNHIDALQRGRMEA